MDEDILVVHLWACPRSLSTCTMYSFGQRSDTQVFDEPLYGYWLKNNPELFRPYRDQLLSTQGTDGNDIIGSIESKIEPNKKILFLKHIAKQSIGIDRKLFYKKNHKHIFLIRDPLPLILAWERKSEIHQEGCSLETLGFLTMINLFSDIKRNSQCSPIVVDSNILKENPKETLILLCDRLQIPFDEKQLSWEAGPKPHIDGLWAEHWYDSVHKSTGFNEYQPNPIYNFKTIAPDQLDLYRITMPLYDYLKHESIGFETLNPGSSVFNFSSSPSETKLADSRNGNILVWVGDRLVPRESAKVSVFDSAVQGGDAVWEGLRIYDGRIFKFDEHISRLFDSAKALAYNKIPSKDYIKQAVFRTLAANGMKNNAHIRLTLTRGPKITSSMNPSFNLFGTNLIVLAEWKAVGDVTTYDNNKGIKLISSSIRRNVAQCVDSKIHHCNMINNILPKIQANLAGVADAVMLDPQGFVSETNATNIFLIKNGNVCTPTADSCLPGITRNTVIGICQDLGFPIQIRNISLTELYIADEVFTTGTMGELTPVIEIDGRIIGNGPITLGPTLYALQEAYRNKTKTEGIILPF